MSGFRQRNSFGGFRPRIHQQYIEFDLAVDAYKKAKKSREYYEEEIKRKIEREELRTCFASGVIKTGKRFPARTLLKRRYI